MGVTAADQPEDYPGDWEVDVLLGDGSVCHLRPVLPDDDELLREFHTHLSKESIYYRYFSPYQELLDKDIDRLIAADHHDRIALMALVGGHIIGVAQLDRVSGTDGEVAFTVRDDYQSRGLGSILLEHLAFAAREEGIRRFVAEVLPGNRKMAATFSRAGYTVAQELDEGIVKLAFEIEPNREIAAIRHRREARADARSAWRLLNPRGIAIIGASQREESMGGKLVHTLVAGGYRGRIFPIHPEAGVVAGLPAFRTVADAPGPVDLAIVAVPADLVDDLIPEIAAAGAQGVVVVSAGFAETGQEGADYQRALLRLVRGEGMRLVGPSSLGLINNDPRVQLQASFAETQPPRGPLALYTQSAPLSIGVLNRLAQRRLGIASCVATGNRADLGADELLQMWRDDSQVRVVLLYLERMADPNKFLRLVRAVAAEKPVVVVRSGRASRAFPTGTQNVRTSLNPAAAADLLASAGVIEAKDLDQMVDLAGLLACQPEPTSKRVTVVGDSWELVNLVADTCATAGLQVQRQRAVNPGSNSVPLVDAVRDALAEPNVGSLMVVHVSPVGEDPRPLQEALLREAEVATSPVLAVLHSTAGINSILTPAGSDANFGSIPTFAIIQEAVEVLKRVVDAAETRRASAGIVPERDEINRERSRIIVRERLESIRPREKGATVSLVGTQLSELLDCYGIALLPSMVVGSEDEAEAAADQVGWPVTLRSTSVRREGGIDGQEARRFNLGSAATLRQAYLSLVATVRQESAARILVQATPKSGIETVVRLIRDPVFGPVLAFGSAGLVGEVVADRSYHVAPISDTAAGRLIQSPDSAQLLAGYGGRPPVDMAALQELVCRVGLMGRDLPQLQRLDLNPVVAAPSGVQVIGAAAWLREPDSGDSALVRRLPRM